LPKDLIAGIVRILKPDGKRTAGTGFVVSEEGLIATCSHVVQDEESQRRGDPRPEFVDLAFLASGERRRATVEPDWWRPVDAEDVAILRLEGALPEGVVPLPLGTSAEARGHTFETFSFPRDKPVEGMPGQCLVIGQTTENGHPVLQLRSNEVALGSSGAPVWDGELGIVIGMVVSIIPQDEHGKQAETSFITLIETLRAVCPELQLPKGEPYRGLQVFEVEHADLYFGREAAIEELLGALVQHDAVLLVGVSGSGKSSLVRAGLKKGLRERPAFDLAERVRCLAVPGHSPMFNLALALTKLPALEPAAVAQAFGLPLEALVQEGELRHKAAEDLDQRSPQALADALLDLAPPQGLLLVMDQFERLYTECPSEAVQERFVKALLTTAGGRVKVLLALRADFYGLALAHEGLEQVVRQDGQVTLGRMAEEDLQAAIEEPARKMGRSFQPKLVERLIADVRGQAGDLPLLEFALTELWERDNQKGVLTLATYEALGYETPEGERFPGVQWAIARRAEAVWQELDKAEQRAAQRVFLNLVTPGLVDERGERVAEDASRRAWQAEWDEQTQQVARELADARLLTAGQDPVSGRPTIEVGHEALIRAWPRLQKWVEDYRDFVRWYDHDLAPFLRRWQERKQHPDFSLPEAMLPQAQNWLVQYPDLLEGPAAKYIRASVAAKRRRQRRSRTIVVIGLAVVTMLALLLGVKWRQAVHEADAHATAQAQSEMQRATAEAAQATAIAEADIRATAQAQEEVRRQEAEAAQATALAEANMRAAAQAEAEQQRNIALARGWAALGRLEFSRTAEGPLIGTILGIESMRVAPSLGGDQLLRRSLSVLPRLAIQVKHDGEVTSMAFSPDGRWLVTGSDDHTARVWDLITGRETSLLQHDGEIWSVDVSPDGQRVATGSNDNTVRVWDVAGGKELARMEHGGGVTAVAFSPDGQWLVSGSLDGRARIWKTSNGKETTCLQHDRGVTAIAFSPDGRWIVSGSRDGTARVWDAASGEEMVRLQHDAGVTAIACSPNGQWVASGSRDDTARVWNLITGEETRRLQHNGDVTSVAFSPDGQWVVSGSDDKTARVWDPDTGEEVARMIHNDWVGVATFSPDGRWVASGSKDGTVRVWNPIVGEEVARIEQDDAVWAVAFSADGRRLISRTTGRIAKVWNLATGEEIASLQHEGRVTAIILNYDGQKAVTGSDDNTVRVWNAATGQKVTQMKHDGDVTAVAFSPDGRWVASGSRDNTVRVWDPNTGEERFRLQHEGAVNTVVFSPDGRWIASGSDDKTARVWELVSGVEVARIQHNGWVTAVAFSPDSQWLVSGSWDGTARVWNLITEDEITCMKYKGGVVEVAFSPNGQRAVSVSTDHVTRVWDPATGEEVTRLQHGNLATTVAFSLSGQWLVTGSEDGTVRVWQTATGEEVARLQHDGPVNAVAFSPDGQWVISGSSDGTIRVWLWRLEDLIAEACRRLPRNLTHAEWQQYIGSGIPYDATCSNLPAPEK